MFSYDGLTDAELATIKSDKATFCHKVTELMVDIERIAMALQINTPQAQKDEIQRWMDALVVWANPPTPDYLPTDVQAWGQQGAQILLQGEQLLLKYLPRGTVIDTTDLHNLLDVPGTYPAETYKPVWSTQDYQQAIASGVAPETAEKIVTQVMPADRQTAIVQAVQAQGVAYVPNPADIPAVTTGQVAPINVAVPVAEPPPLPPAIVVQPETMQPVVVTQPEEQDKKWMYLAGGAVLLLLLTR